MRREYAGFTLVELLTALAILMLLLGALSSFTVGTCRSYRSAWSHAQLSAVAEDVVLQELSLAGYGLVLHEASAAAATVGININARADLSDSVRMHHLEHRWRAQPEWQETTLDAATDGQGNWNLYRREAGATRQPAVQGVTNLKLHSFINEAREQILPRWSGRLAPSDQRAGGAPQLRMGR